MFADLLLMSRGFTSAITRLVSRSRAYQSLLTLPYVGSTVASSLLLYTSCTECFRHNKAIYGKFWEIRISPPLTIPYKFFEWLSLVYDELVG